MNDAELFGGQCVSVWSKDPAKGGVLENAHISHLGDRAFIVGRIAKRSQDDKDPRVGLTYWFPVDEVLMITEFPDLDAIRRYYDERDRRNSAKQTGILLRLWGRNKSP
jgi:hypothetical protein